MDNDAVTPIELNQKTFPQEKLEIHKYISEKAEEIRFLIDKHHRVLLNASPGSGKTTFFAKMCISHLKSKRKGRIIFCSPFLIIQSQFKRVIEKKGLKINLELNHTTTRNYLLPTDRIITSTYKGISRIRTELMAEDLIIVDEAHSLLFTYGNRTDREFFTETIKLLHHTEAKIVLMTGTPYSGITNILDLTEIKIIKEDQKAKINIQYTNEKDTAVALSFATSCLKLFGRTSLNIIYIKSTKKCEAIKAILEKNLECKAFVLTAGKKDTPVYQLLKQESLIPKDINFLITTNVISTGANILNDNIGKALMLNEANPTEIKQFSKRFRRKLDIEIDVINKKFNETDLPSIEIRENILKARNHQRAFFNSSLKVVQENYLKHKEHLNFDHHYYQDTDTGGPIQLIDTILERMLIQEAYFADQIAETYNTPKELVDVLNNYDDVISVNAEIYENEFSGTDLGEGEINLMKEIQFNLIINDFIQNQHSFLKSAYWYLNIKKELFLKYRMVDYLNPEIETRLISPAVVDNKKLDLFSETNFIKEILVPLLDIDEFFKDRAKSLFFIKTVKSNKRKATLLTIHLNQIFFQYYELETSNYPSFAPDLKLKNEINKHLLNLDRELNSIVKILHKAYDYLIHQEYLNYNDLNEYLVLNCKWAFPINKEHFVFKEIDVDKETYQVRNFRKNLLKAIANAIFYIQPKQKYRVDEELNGRRGVYLHYKTLPFPCESSTSMENQEVELIRKISIVLKYKRHTRKFQKLNFGGGTRILNNKELILYSVVNQNFYNLFRND